MGGFPGSGVERTQPGDPSSCHSAVPSSGHVWCRARGERDTLGSPVYSQSGTEGEVGFEKPGVDSRLSIRSGWCARKKRNAVTATWKRWEQRVVQAGIQFSLLVRWLRVCECTYLLKCTCIPQTTRCASAIIHRGAEWWEMCISQGARPRWGPTGELCPPPRSD